MSLSDQNFKTGLEMLEAYLPVLAERIKYYEALTAKASGRAKGLRGLIPSLTKRKAEPADEPAPAQG